MLFALLISSLFDNLEYPYPQRNNDPIKSVKNNVYLKTENLQQTGSFKLRGAYYKISKLSPPQERNAMWDPEWNLRKTRRL